MGRRTLVRGMTGEESFGTLPWWLLTDPALRITYPQTPT